MRSDGVWNRRISSIWSCNTESMSGSTLNSPPPSQSRMHMTSSLARIAVLFALASCAHATDRLRPTFASEVEAPQENVVLPLLKVVCGEGLRTVTAKGQKAFGCGGSNQRANGVMVLEITTLCATPRFRFAPEFSDDRERRGSPLAHAAQGSLARAGPRTSTWP